MSNEYTGPLEAAGPCCWKIPKSYREDMRVDGLIFADDKLIEQIRKDQGPEQVANVATLPGIQKASLAMPDIHWGYGFAIGGVAATDPEAGRGHLARRRRLRHQLRRPPAALEPRLGRRQAAHPAPRRSALPRHSHGRRPVRAVHVQEAEARPADGSRDRPMSSDKGWGTEARPLEFTEAGGRLDGRRSRPR